MRPLITLLFAASIAFADTSSLTLQGSLPSTGTVGTSYSGSLSASNGTPPYTFSLDSGALPNGLNLSPAGQVSGTPSKVGSFQFAIKVKDKNSATASGTFTITIAPDPPALAITTTSPLPSGTVGTAYSQSLAASGGTPPYRWLGSAPDGLTLGADGSVTGMPFTSGGFLLAATVTDSGFGVATKTFAITINPAPPLTITTTSPLPSGTVAVAYSQSLSASGGVPPYRWSGSAPDGLTLGSNGSITGTPIVSGSVSFTATVNDSSTGSANRNFAITINPPLIITTTSPLPSGTVGVAYSQSLSASGGTPPYRWSGSAPAGLTLGADGSITGTPGASGSFNFTATVNGSASGSANRNFAITINPPPLMITTTSPLPSGTVGAAYSQILSALGGTPPYRWSGSAPAGLTLGADGSIMGTPGASGSFNFTATVNDSASGSANRNFAITINPPPLITTTSPLPSGTVGVAYSQGLSASGGTPPYRWSGSAPAGLALGADGSITGTPATPGSFNFTATVNDSTSGSANRNFAITINPPALMITTTSPLLSGAVGAAYSQTLSASGGTPPYRWSGAAPAGLTVGADGSLSGVPTNSGAFSFTATVIDSAAASANRAFAITINPAALTITTTSPLPAATVGLIYSQIFSAVGGTPPYRWSGAPPAGLALGADGSLTGTPNASGTFNFTATVTDNASQSVSRTFAITISLASLTIITSSPLPSGVVGATYSLVLAASGGAPPYRWSGSAPAGLNVGPDGSITGVPSAAGRFTVVATVTDSASGVASKQLILNINATSSPLSITTPSMLTSIPVRTVYSQPLNASGGTPPYVWSVSAGTLPNGINLSPDGTLAGSPSSVGTFGFTIQITDAASLAANKFFILTVTSGLTITTAPSLPPGEAGSAYSQTLGTAAGVPPLVWSITAGALPAGLSIDGSSGTIAGTVSSSGSFNFSAQVKDSTGAVAVKQFTMTIAPALTITTPPVLPDASVSAAYSQTLAATGGIPPLSWSVSAGQLPPGLNLDPASGVISGNITTPGTFNFTVQVRDSAALQASKPLAITVAAGLTISTAASLPDGTAGAAYTQTLSAAGGRSPYSWSIASGSLAPGLSLDPTSGQISGIASSAGPFSFTAKVSDAAGASASRQFTMTIGASLTITTDAALPGSTAGAAYSVLLVAAGGVAPYDWALEDGSLPDGLTLDESSGVISGAPRVTGAFQFSVQVSDSGGGAFSEQFSLNVGAPPLPALKLDSVAQSADAAAQMTLNLNSAASYPLPIPGTATLRFMPDPAAGADDPAIQFATGGRSISFVIPANATQPVPPIALQTGTVAGTIELDFTIQGNPQPDLTRTITIARSAPSIRSVKVVRNAGGFELQVTGFSTPRNVTQATVQFTGSGLQTSQLAVSLASAAGSWYQSAASQPFGSQFSLGMPFTIQGSPDAIQSVMLTLTNDQGDSTPVRASF